MASAAGSGDDPAYEQMSFLHDDLQGRVSVGITEETNPFSGERWDDDEGSRQRGTRRSGDLTPEQQAVDLLVSAEAAEAAEPDYDFASAEGGNGSPEQGEGTVPVDRSQLIALDGAVPRGSERVGLTSVGAAAPRDEGSLGRLGERGGRQPHAQYPVQGQYAWSGRSARPAASDSARTDVLEALVQQLMEQNEHLRNEVAEARSRTFQPPWTSFAGGEHSSVPVMPAEGPGDQLLAATRALQSLTLRETPDVQVVGQLPLNADVSSSGIGREEVESTVDETGAVVINSESPKYFAMQVPEHRLPSGQCLTGDTRWNSPASGTSTRFTWPASRPQLETVEEFARTVLSELELLSVAMPDTVGKPSSRQPQLQMGSLVQEQSQANVGHVGAHEQDMPVVDVKLAFGGCQLLVNPQGTLLSKTHVSPILSVRALLALGFKIEWDSLKCRIWHPNRGELDLDSSSGCPEVSEQEALALIKEYESLVERNEHRSARLHCIMRDLETLSQEDLADLIVQRDSHADAAMQTLLTKVFPSVDRELLSQAAVSLQDQEGESFAWNRRMRRRCDQASGILVHLFSSGCKRAFEGLADRSKLALLTVERPENLLSDSTFRYLLQQASKGRVRGIVGALPYRTFAWSRYLKEGGEQFHRPLRLRGESLGDYGIQDLNCREQAQRRMDDLLILRIMVLTVVSTAANRARQQEEPSLVFENPEDPQEDLRGGYPMQSLNPPESGFASIWAVPEWEALEKFAGLHRVSFHQGVIGDTPEVSGGNLGSQQNWAGWSPGLQCAIGNMLWRAFQELTAGPEFKVKTVDAGFLEHLKNNHTPYRRDCKYCVQGGARQRQHRKVLAPQGWTLSVDTTGPFPLGLDEGTNKAKYLLVGVLSVPILSANGSAVDEPADRDPLITVESFAKGLEDREWFVNRGVELEDPLPEPSQRELKEAKESWNSWEKVVRASREDWLREAKSEYLPKVEMVDVLFTEAVESKRQQEVTAAVSRMYAKAISDGYDVRRVHTDRGREFNNAALKAFCSRFALHQTFALAEEHQTNGRAEGAILRIKSKTRAILHAAGQDDLKEWPLAAKLAAHQLRGIARARLKLPAEPTLPFNTKAQVLQRSFQATRRCVRFISGVRDVVVLPHQHGERLSMIRASWPEEDLRSVEASYVGLRKENGGAVPGGGNQDNPKGWHIGEAMLYELDRRQQSHRGRLAAEGCKLVVGDVEEDEAEREPMPYDVPSASRDLQLCPVSQGVTGITCSLERVAWRMGEAVEACAEALATDHRARCRMLETLMGGDDCWLSSIETGWLDEVKTLERELKAMQGFEVRALQSLEETVWKPGCNPAVRSIDMAPDALPEGPAEPVGPPCNGATLSDPEDVAPLQSKIISQEQVRQEMPKWCGPLQEEYDNLTKDSGTVRPLTDQEFSELLNDTSIALELIPGKGVYVHKSTGKRRARIVCCGNHQSSESHSKTELFASGIGGEGIRMLVRRAALMRGWDLATADVKAAFLQAPVIAGQCGGKPRVIVVKVPQIMRASGVCSERYWLVQKAMYGLAVSPKCWVTHRNKVLRDLRIPYKGGHVRCVPMPADANMWKLQFETEELGGDGVPGSAAQMLGLLGLYVDDILTAGPSELLKAVFESMKSAWQLSTPEYLSAPGDSMKFSGFQVERTEAGYLLHQTSYVMDLLDQYREDITGEEIAPAIKSYEISELKSDEERHTVTKRAQTLVGQLLWVSNRTRPDLAFGVSMAGQKITSNPAESLARAEHLIRYLRHAPRMGLSYGSASGQCGKWDQLKYQEVEASIDVFTDASFCADEQSRSFGSIHMYWAGALIAWVSSRQTLIASHTAESELYSLAEGHLLGKAMRPTVAALLDVKESAVDCRLYCDNAAAVQLCALEAGSWRTRHLRLRGAVIRHDLEEGLWQLSHLEGVFMPADLGTKAVGSARRFLGLKWLVRGVWELRLITFSPGEPSAFPIQSEGLDWELSPRAEEVIIRRFASTYEDICEQAEAVDRGTVRIPTPDEQYDAALAYMGALVARWFMLMMSLMWNRLESFSKKWWQHYRYESDCALGACVCIRWGGLHREVTQDIGREKSDEASTPRPLDPVGKELWGLK
ncbi:RE1 [Symbiodinium sp. CCMP2456]|nr:RE1 [Symbiodinium sp. CCMP2456]